MPITWDGQLVMKKGSISEPDFYLGAKLCQVQLDNGMKAWGMSSSKYVQEAISNTEKYLDANYPGQKLTKRATAPWLTDYVSELDTTPELDSDKSSYYQSLIGILHWIVDMGRVDMITKVLTLASHMALP